jgi:hypothetical protein
MDQVNHAPDDYLLVPCPRCNRMIDRIQEYEVPVVVLLPGLVAWNRDLLFGCPRCVRAALFRRMLWSIPLTNIACWFFAPWYIILLVHSRTNDRPGVPPKFRGLAEAGPNVQAPAWQGTPQGRGVRIVVVLVILAAVLAFTFLVLPKIVPR